MQFDTLYNRNKIVKNQRLFQIQALDFAKVMILRKVEPLFQIDQCLLVESKKLRFKLLTLQDWKFLHSLSNSETKEPVSNSSQQLISYHRHNLIYIYCNYISAF